MQRCAADRSCRVRETACIIQFAIVTIAASPPSNSRYLQLFYRRRHALVSLMPRHALLPAVHTRRVNHTDPACQKLPRSAQKPTRRSRQPHQVPTVLAPGQHVQHGGGVEPGGVLHGPPLQHPSDSCALATAPEVREGARHVPAPAASNTTRGGCRCRGRLVHHRRPGEHQQRHNRHGAAALQTRPARDKVHREASAAAETSVPSRLQGAEAHARGLPLLGAIQVATLPKQGVLAAPVPRLQRAPKHLRAPSLLGASAEASCRCRRRARRPTPAGSRYWGQSAPPFCPSKVCHLRPRRAASAPEGK